MEGSPNRFLDLIAAQRKGRFKVYMGMSAGVGKTCRMLQEAHELLSRGVDVRIGFIETHGRPDTEALVKGLPTLPLRRVYYGTQQLAELDVDAILAERPQVVLIDELPHTNVPGGRHAKRWQDVEFMLDSGLHIISAMNVQHLESLNRRVAALTGVTVDELVPDRLIDQADELVLVDLSPDDLVLRLQAGKVYPPERAEHALAHFFQPEVLMQLRELALQVVARHQGRNLRNVLPGAKLLPIGQAALALSGNPRTSKALMRRVCQLARPGWYALYIQTKPAIKGSSASERTLLDLFEEVVRMGGMVITRSIEPGQTLAQTLVACVQEMNIELLVIGKTERDWWQRLTRGSLTDELIRLSQPLTLDILIVSIEREAMKSTVPKLDHP